MTEASTVVVIDQTGRPRGFDADDWDVDANGYLNVLKDGKAAAPVATFPPGYIAVYRPGSLREPPVVNGGGGGSGGAYSSYTIGSGGGGGGGTWQPPERAG